jgi:hypothetical protein
VEDTERTAGRWDVDPANVSAWNKKYVLVTEGTERYIVKKKDLRTTEHKKEKDPVFPTVKGQVVKPKPEDVVQGELGDCYLEAVLAAVAAKNPETIMGMIKDYGDSVTVRFYDVKRANPNAQPTFTPKYVRVEKSRARAGKELIYDQGALWVGLIEKAYAAGKFGSMASKAGAARAKATASYADIESGQEQHAFEVVLGRPASQHNLVTDGPGRWNTNHKDLPWSDDEINEWRNAQTTNTFTGLVANTVYQADDGKIMRWFAWLLGGTGKAAIDKVVDEANAKKERDAGDKTAYQRFAIRLEDWERVFTDEGLDAELAGPMLTYLKDFFPGKRGTGKYTKHQLATWDLINDALNNKKLVTAGTHKTQGRSKEGVGKSGGEEKSKGLAGGHAYTILDTAPGDNGRKLVKIRNPWGEYARVYDKTTGKAAAYKPPADAKTGQDTSEAAKGVSWLDLDDLLKRFDEITVS